METPRTDRVYDALIVGSGAGGAAAAHRLTRAGLDVLLLEKGRDLPRDASTLDFRIVVQEGRFKSREPWVDGRGRTLEPEEYFNLGGKTRWYGAALLRFAPEEFLADEAHQCRAWPIAHAEMQPWYEEAERLLRVRKFGSEPNLSRILRRLVPKNGSEPFFGRPGENGSEPISGRRTENGSEPFFGWRAQALPLGLDPLILGDPREARHFDGFASVVGLKADACSAFLDPLRDAANLTIATGEEVVALCAAPGRPAEITGVRTAGGATFQARAVLLAAGALHTPRLVQRHVQAGLDRELPAASSIGRNLKLHLLTAMLALGGTRQTDLLRKTDYLTHGGLPHSSVQPLGFDGELLGTLIPALVPRPLARAIGDRAYGFFLQTEDGSHSDNRVVDRGAGHPPVLDYDTSRLAPAEAEHRRLVARLRRSLAGAGLIAVSKRIGLAGTAHACGTMIAGRDPADSVVDPVGRVHGMRGLYVVDGSVLPRSSRVNPSLSIYGWSLRVADALAGRLLAEHATGRAASQALPA
jgi:choline dehydrogenase-like flavoprotein